MRRRFIALAILLAGCSLVTFTKTANDAIACAIGIAKEVQAGQADPSFVALGHNPTTEDVLKALQGAQAMLPATVAACAAFAADFSLPSAPTTAMAIPGGKVLNPWTHR